MSENRAGFTNQPLNMKYLLKALIKYNASDLHLKVGRPPLFRINGRLIPAKMPEVSPPLAEGLLFSLLTAKQMVQLEEKRQVDFSFQVKELGRFRCNVFYQSGELSAAIRMIPLIVPDIDELRVPAVIKDWVVRPRGLVLVTGSTGAGKSTTLAGMVQHVNQTSPVHVITLEDPIEFVYKDFKAAITQREMGSDFNFFKEGLSAGLRQDPDIIMIGELRDSETIQTALTAAETGHLVISTLHTFDACSTIDRLINVFPAQSQNQVRVQLASTLVGVLSQQLVVRADGSGRVPACEVMVKSPAIESYILKNQLDLIPDAIATSNDYYQMQSMNQALEKLIRAGTITAEEGLKSSLSPDDLQRALAGFSRLEGFQLEKAS